METVLAVRHVSKKIDSDIVLDQIDFSLRRGELHLIWGENGAGKSVLMRVIGGIMPFDSGEIEILGAVYQHKTPDPSSSSAIAMLFQENSLVSELTVFDNLFMNRAYGFIRKRDYFLKNIPQDCAGFAACLLPILNAQVRDINPAQYQVLGIMKTLLLNRSILFFDEPMSYLNRYERTQFYGILNRLKAAGKSIILITHSADRIQEWGDRISIIKNGRLIRTVESGSFGDDSLVSNYVESGTLFCYPKLRPAAGERVLDVERLTGCGLQDISFQLREGEIIGFTGSVSSGKGELAKLLMGILRKDYGILRIRGQRVLPHDPAQMLERGFSYLPAIHNNSGVFPMRDVAFNIAGISQKNDIAENADTISRHYIRRLRIKACRPDAPIRALSCGNRKKVLLSRGLLNESQIYLFDEPTSGMDLDSRNELYNIINHLLLRGAGVIIVSSNFTELSAMCDRIYFLHDGRIVDEIPYEDATPEMLYNHCTEAE